MGSDLGASDNEDSDSQGGKKSSSSNIALTQRTADPGAVEIVRSMQERVVLTGLSSGMWTSEHNGVMTDFVMDTSKQVLLIYLDEQNGLMTCSTFPAFDVAEMAYFAREEYAAITMENLVEVFQFGTIHGTYVDGLLRTMHGLYAPTFFENQLWPDSFRNEFSSQLHKFMAHLTDSQYKSAGHTILYVPDEGHKMEDPLAHKDKELVQRLEVVVVHWTRQIKEVLSSQESMDTVDNSGPLEEIEFWKERCEDLSGLTSQLNEPAMQRVVQIIDKAKSSYVAPFNRLARVIQVQALYTPGIPQELLQEVDDFFSRLRGSHPEVLISFSRQQEAQQQVLSCKRPTTVTKGPKPPAKKRQALPPGPFGYVGAAPPILDGTADDPPCPYCHLGPCIITRGPSWLVGSSAPSLGNLAKRYGLYRKFWRVLRQLGVWSHPLYLNEKVAHTTLTDVREVMPKCVVTDVRRRFPNPPGVHYKDFEPSSFIA